MRMLRAFLIAGIVLIPEYVLSAEYDDIFPMEKGTKWVYKGNVKWTVQNSNKVKSGLITWTTKIIESYDFKCCRIAIAEGMIDQLSWYEPGQKSCYSLLVKQGKMIYHLYPKEEEYPDTDGILKARKFAKKISENYEIILNKAEPMLNLPLFKGKHWAQANEERKDDMYCWYVKDVMLKSLKIRGISFKKHKHKIFRIAYYTNPDHEIIDFVPGVGIVRRIYDHHGTVAFSDMRLAEFARGKK